MWFMERVIGTDELKSGDRKTVYVDDIPALVIRIQDEYFVTVHLLFLLDSVILITDLAFVLDITF